MTNENVKIIERVLALIDNSGKTDKAIDAEIALKGAIAQWRRKNQKPTIEQIIKIAEYFDVSTDYILLGKEKSHNTINNGIMGNSNVGNSIQVNDGHLDKVELEIISTFRALSLSDKAKFISELCNKGEK